MIYHETVVLNGTDKVLIEVLDARSVKLIIAANIVQDVMIKRDKVSKISIDNIDYVDINNNNKIFIKINDKIQVYTITEIVKIADKTYALYTCSRTKSSTFLTPLLGENRAFFWWDKFYVNTYIGEDNTLYLLYRFFDAPVYLTFEHQLKHTVSNCIGNFEPDPYHTMFRFKLLDDQQDIVELFKQGRYSQFPETYKQAILKFHGYNKEGSLAQILYKGSGLKQQLELQIGESLSDTSELYSIPNLEEETYEYKPLIILT